MQKLKSLSIFFPTYNEELNIEQTIRQSIEAAKKVSDLYEVIIVNDASTDGTVGIVTNLQNEYGQNLRLVSHDSNKGYGGALITGFAESKHDYVFFSDADLQFDYNELNLVVEHVNTHDVIIGYRHDRQDPLPRILFAKGWNVLNRILFNLHVKDIDCAFKLFKKEVMSDFKITSQGNMISAELLINLSQKGIIFKEIPVTHLPRTKGEAKGVNVKVILRAFKEIFKLFFSPLGSKSRKQFFTFATIGIFNTALDIGMYILLTRSSDFLSTHFVGTKVFTYILGTLSAFTLNKFITFKQKSFSSHEFVRFYIVMGSTAFINAGLTYILTSKLGLYDIFSVIIATGFSFIFNFIFIKLWVFVEKQNN